MRVPTKCLALMFVGIFFVISNIWSYFWYFEAISDSSGETRRGLLACENNGDDTTTTATTSSLMNANLSAENELLRSHVKALLLQQQQAREEEANQMKAKSLRAPTTYAFDHNDLDAMERHTCFPVKDICTTGTEWFYRTQTGNTRAYQPNFAFRHKLMKGHNIPDIMAVNNTFFYDIHWPGKQSDVPVCRISSISNHVVVTSAYLAMAMETYYQVTGGLYQLWKDVSAPWWKETPNSPHIQIYALTRAEAMSKRGLETEEQVLPSLNALLAGFTSHPVQSYLNLHNASSGCQCFERLIFCGVSNRDEYDPKHEQKRRKKEPHTYQPPLVPPVTHIAASKRVGDPHKKMDYGDLRTHVRRGAYDVYPNITQKVAQFKQNAILTSLEHLKADRTKEGEGRSSSGLDTLDMPNHLNEWTMIGFSQRNLRRRWLNLNQIMDHCLTHWFPQHKVVCVEINLDTPYGADPENQVIMHAGLDALIGIHGSQFVHSVWMPDRSYNLEILPHLTAKWGSWDRTPNAPTYTQNTHTPTCNGGMIVNSTLNHVGYGLNETSMPNCTAAEWTHVTNCNDDHKWDGRDFLVPPDMIDSFVQKFLLPSPSGGTATTTPPRKCTDYDELAEEEFVLYNVVCQDENSDIPITKQYYRPRTSFSHLEKRR